MKSLSEKGFAVILIVIAIVVALGGAGATAYYIKKSSDEKKAREAAAQQVETGNKKVGDKPASTEPEKKPQTTPACVRDTKMFVAVPEGHALRNEKALNATKLVAVPFRAEVTVGCKDGDWYSAEYNGQVGWAFGGYLSATQPAAGTTVAPTKAICSQNSFHVYAAKSPTIGRYGSFENPWSNGELSVAYGTELAGAICALNPDATVMDGYMLYNDAYFRYGDLSTTKP